MPGVAESFKTGHGRFLDVGVGVAAISIAMCQRFPGATAVGLDVLPEVVRLARRELAGAERAEQIEIRQQSITELVDLDAFDLAWVAQPFIPRAALDTGLPRVLLALRPAGALVMPVMAVPDGEIDLERAFMDHASHLMGGGPVEPDQMLAQLDEVGFVQVAARPYFNQVVITAHRP